jgi:4-diphosphocytidyl-2-C-methyl-D-erythritol kinase
MPNKIEINAYAKINLALEILKRRADGFHEIMSIIQTISLYDRLVICAHESLKVTMENLDIPAEENLAFKAALVLRELTGCHKGANVLICKRIPLSAGLGGGSSDAAAVLRGLNELWELGLSLKKLERIASNLGSDVPFFIRGGTALIEGRGEKVRPIPDTKETWYFLLIPQSHMKNKTRNMFSLIETDNLTKGFLTRKLETRLRFGGDLPSELIFNGFDSLAQKSFPDLDKFRNIMEALGGKKAHLSGSGPALYCRVSSEAIGKAMQALAQHKYNIEAYVVRSIEANLANSMRK